MVDFFFKLAGTRIKDIHYNDIRELLIKNCLISDEVWVRLGSDLQRTFITGIGGDILSSYMGRWLGYSGVGKRFLHSIGASQIERPRDELLQCISRVASRGFRECTLPMIEAISIDSIEEFAELFYLISERLNVHPDILNDVMMRCSDEMAMGRAEVKFSAKRYKYMIHLLSVIQSPIMLDRLLSMGLVRPCLGMLEEVSRLLEKAPPEDVERLHGLADVLTRHGAPAIGTWENPYPSDFISEKLTRESNILMAMSLDRLCVLDTYLAFRSREVGSIFTVNEFISYLKSSENKKEWACRVYSLFELVLFDGSISERDRNTMLTYVFSNPNCSRDVLRLLHISSPDSKNIFEESDSMDIDTDTLRIGFETFYKLDSTPDEVAVVESLVGAARGGAGGADSDDGVVKGEGCSIQ